MMAPNRRLFQLLATLVALLAVGIFSAAAFHTHGHGEGGQEHCLLCQSALGTTALPGGAFCVPILLLLVAILAAPLEEGHSLCFGTLFSPRAPPF